MGLVSLLWLGAVLAFTSGCATVVPRLVPSSAIAAERAVVPGLARARFWGDEVPKDILAAVNQRLPGINRLASSAEIVDGRPVVEILALSGGGSDGAFGAGFLKGWTATGKRPRFEVVTGVSAGAIIAPFAFLGSRYDRPLEEIWTQYQTSELIVAQILPGILGGSSLLDTAPLAKLIERYIDRPFLRAIAAEYRKGRLLLVGTTNIDAQRPVVWNMGEIAASGHPNAIELFRKVIMASAAIPGAFPPVAINVEIDGKIVEEMHVDGGVTRSMFVAPVQLNLRLFDRFYPTPPQRRIFIINNAKVTPEFDPVKPTTIALASRSIFTLTKSQHLGDIYRIWNLAKESGADFNLAAVPPSFTSVPKQAFDPAYQRDLFNVGVEVGRAGGRWQKLPPELRPAPPLR